MANVFRSVRKDLLEEGRIEKYIRYAIGETILVVLGILIALSLNNWNENRENRNEERVILIALKANLSMAKIQTDYNQEDEEELKSAILFLLNISESDLDSLGRSQMDSIFYTGVWNLETDMPVLNVYEDIKNTDKIKLITNDSIRLSFTFLEEQLDLLDIMVDDRLYVHQLRIDNIAENDINFVHLLGYLFSDLNTNGEVPNDYSEILSDQRIRNLLAIKLRMTQDVINYLEDFEYELIELSGMIEREISR